MERYWWISRGKKDQVMIYVGDLDPHKSTYIYIYISTYMINIK